MMVWYMMEYGYVPIAAIAPELPPSATKRVAYSLLVSFAKVPTELQNFLPK